MTPGFNIVRTCGLFFYLVLLVSANQNTESEPWIVSINIEAKTCVDNICKYLLSVRGGEFLGHSSWRLSPKEGNKGDSCEEWLHKYETIVIETTQWTTKIRASVPVSENKIYFCLRSYGGRWVHQGADIYLDPSSKISTDLQQNSQKSDLEEATSDWADLSHDTDVNHLPNVARPTKYEAKDIEVLVKDKYVPLLDLDANNNVQEANNNINRLKTTTEHNYNNRHDNDETLSDIKDKNHIQNNNNLLNINELHESKYLSFNNHRHKRFANKTEELISEKEIYDAKINLENSVSPVQLLGNNEHYEDNDSLVRKKRKVRKERKAPLLRAEDLLRHPKIDGLRVEHADKEPKIIEETIPSVLAGDTVHLRLFGERLTSDTVIGFTLEKQEYGTVCKYLEKGEYLAMRGSISTRSAVFDITPPSKNTDCKLYICAKNVKRNATNPLTDEGNFVHQGHESYKILAVHNPPLPTWLTVVIVIVCLMFSALFSGLNLGLMSMDKTQLKIIANTGTDDERKYARAIMPARDHGNYLLCSIVLGNVAVNSTLTILLDSITSGLAAVIISTFAIVLFGEITPQAVCSRHGLFVGAKTIMITKAVMALTAPLGYPVSKLLDYFLGEEIGSVYNRERLKELVKVTTDVNDLDKDEVNIISGALEMRKKTVSDVMTKLEDVFMLPITSVLDFETMSEIVKSGYSRIPVYEGERGNIVTVLFIKDLAFVDPDDNTPLRTLCQYYQNPCNFVFEDVTLDVMFKQFKEGQKGHMAFVHRINNEGEGDPFYETIGLVTLEDVIEEMIQAEIVDETDVFMDNRTKRRRKQPQHKLQDFAAFAERHENQSCHISPQLTLATFQFLSTSVDAFRPDTVSETVLRRLLRQDVIHQIKLKGKTKTDPSTYVYQQGKAADYFVLLLEGRVEVTVGRENLVFEAGPFTYFGVQALSQNVGVGESPSPSVVGSLQNLNMDSMLRHTFVPDYSVQAITDLYYLSVKRSLYMAAKRATLMEKGAVSKGGTNDTDIDKLTGSNANIPLSLLLLRSSIIHRSPSKTTKNTSSRTSLSSDKLLQSVDEDMSSNGDQKTPSRQVSPNPVSPHTRSSFAARASPERDFARPEEQEKLLKSP